MKDIKLIVFDVGNTLIETKKGLFISKQVLKDLKTLKAKGYILGLSTLRTEDMIASILAQFPFDFLILMNGGLVKIGERIVYAKPFVPARLEEIKKQAFLYNITMKEYCFQGKTYAIELFSAKKNLIMSDDIYQIYVWERSGTIDITPKGITKLYGLERVCKELKILLSETLAFGDGYNDIDILKAVGYSVAMGNAPNKVCAVATMTTATAGEDGISVGLRKIGLL